jgi:hypothetical protein
MALGREHVVWAAALWLEKHYGALGPSIIAERIDTLMLEDDIVGVEMWQKIAERYDTLSEYHNSHN